MLESLSAEELAKKSWDEIIEYGEKLAERVKEMNAYAKRIKKKVEVLKILLGLYNESEGYKKADLISRIKELIVFLETKFLRAVGMVGEEYTVFLKAVTLKVGKTPKPPPKDEFDKLKKED